MSGEQEKNLWESDGPNPDPWTAAEHNVIKEEDGHWEYQVRKSQNNGKGDAAYNNLDYKPVSVMIPVPKKDDNPYWGWFKKGAH